MTESDSPRNNLFTLLLISLLALSVALYGTHPQSSSNLSPSLRQTSRSSERAALVTSAQPTTIPPGIVSYVPVTITNHQAAPTRAPFQQMLTVNSTEFQASTPAPNFTITATAPNSVTAGQSASSTITITSLYGFSGTVTLSAQAQSGLSCTTTSPPTITGSGTATFSCNSDTEGTYTVTITGTSGSTTKTTTITVTVTLIPPIFTAPPQTPLSLPIIAGIAAVAVVLLLAALFLLRRREQTV